MKNDRLLKINFNITLVLVIGFTLTAILSYRANYQASLDNIEQVSSLTAEGIYYRLTTKFTKPVNISLTMSHDNLLARHLSEEMEHLKDKAYTETTRDYLETYREKYGFASVFLVSTATRRYYTFQGIDRILNRDNPENAWYFRLMDSPQDYALHVDNDEVCGADNEITVFVNCKIKNPDGKVLGIVGVGIRIDSLKELLRGYEEKYHVTASLISESGEVEISTSHSGYEKKDWFELHHQEDIRRELLNWREDASSLELWTPSAPQSGEKSFIVARYLPELSWYLIVAQNTGLLIREMQTQLYQTCAVLVAVILGVLLIITTVIRNFNRQITQLMEERQALFQKATEQQYDNICEFNITGNRPEGRRTEEY
ncbi:MAG: cache domain-containing protein, partial [Desulfovibrio fairfieldensis]|nr:cache domain-containing protein [Desulfovibrio fairfieldensis]